MKATPLALHMTLMTFAAILAGAWPAAATAGPLQPFLDRFVKEQGLPGAVLLVSGPQGREVVASGVADRKTGERMTPQTRFYVASSGKMVTAVATLQLVQENKLRLNAPVFPLLAPVRGIGRLRNIQQVTLEQLLNHRSGLAEYFTDEFGEGVARNRTKRYTADESLVFAYGQKAQSRPGREYNYTNTNYVLLGRLIELADGVSYAQALQRRVLDVAGMPSTSVGAPAAATGIARGYTEGQRGRLEDVSYTGWNAITGDGAIVTTAADYENFLNALFKGDRLLPAGTVIKMCAAQREEPDSGYGLGCSIEDTPWGPAWGHNGSIDGFNADTWYIPKLGVTVVFMANGDHEADDVVERAVRAYLKK